MPQKGYITDELTDYAMAWLEARQGDRPFMLFLSHKAVHSDHIPAARHKGRYAGDPLEARNLIFSPGHEAIAKQLNSKLFDMLQATDGGAMPLARDTGFRAMLRRKDGATEGTFPEALFKPAGPGTR